MSSSLDECWFFCSVGWPAWNCVGLISLGLVRFVESLQLHRTYSLNCRGFTLQQGLNFKVYLTVGAVGIIEWLTRGLHSQLDLYACHFPTLWTFSIPLQLNLIAATFGYVSGSLVLHVCSLTITGLTLPRTYCPLTCHSSLFFSVLFTDSIAPVSRNAKHYLLSSAGQPFFPWAEASYAMVGKLYPKRELR